MTGDMTLTGPHGHDYSSLARCLKQFAGETLVFVPNPGNAGDNVIDMGMYRLFDRLGLRYEAGVRNATYPGRVVVYSGGGALVDIYPGADAFFRANHPVCRNLILLPHTVRSYGDLLAEMDSRCFLFAREQGSLAYLTAHATGGAQVALSHDLAFMLDDATIRALPWHPVHARTTDHAGPWLRMAVKFWLDARRHRTLNCYRRDHEAPEGPVPETSRDLSKLFASADMSRLSCENTVKILRTVLRFYDRVESNRLHIAILATLVGRQVTMHDNSYGKNRAIWDHSMQGYFPNAVFQ